jgi:hypothetical protein
LHELVKDKYKFKYIEKHGASNVGKSRFLGNNK